MSCLEGEGSFGPKDMSLGFGQSQEMLVVCSVFYIYHLYFLKRQPKRSSRKTLVKRAFAFVAFRFVDTYPKVSCFSQLEHLVQLSHSFMFQPCGFPNPWPLKYPDQWFRLREFCVDSNACSISCDMSAKRSGYFRFVVNAKDLMWLDIIASL